MNQTKYFVPLLETFNIQEKSIYVPEIIGKFQPPYTATRNMPAQHILVNGCWNIGELPAGLRAARGFKLDMYFVNPANTGTGF